MYKMTPHQYPAVIKGYSDANWISYIKDSRFTSGYVFTLGGEAISWKSSKQTTIAKSMMEFVEAEWLREFIEDIPRWPKLVTVIRVISIDYVKSKDNIVDPITKGLSRELVSKSFKGMGLKPLKEWVSMKENLTQLIEDPKIWGQYDNLIIEM
ncbi:hypothetical protein Tco_1269615 [Tanacetum coccineum]